MRTLVVDASALGALVFGEPQAEEISQALTDATLVAPSLLWFEMAAIATKKIRHHTELAAQIQAAFGLALRLPIVIRDVDYGETVNLALKSDLTTYDAGYLWLADHLDAELITLDAKLGKIVEGKQGR
ncbi:MAG: type II toxin-antitoxin system VapC family toxin [Proteobacteria bacterium]|nr:type II toxin-antitoxin system VapC family toxin [Pseudomonadota bacterium]